MKKILKTILICALALCLSGVLTACGGLKNFEGDLRVRYDYNLLDYVKPGEYKGIEIYVGNTDITAEEVNNMVQRNRVFEGEESEVTDRPCKVGDIVDIAYQGYTLEEGVDEKDRLIPELTKGFKNGVLMDDLNGSSKVLSMVVGCDELIPGLDEKIEGELEVGETMTVTLTIPEPSWNYPKYAGQEIELKIYCNAIRGIEYTEYNDEYAANSGFGSTTDYEASMKNSLIKAREEQVKNYVNTRVWMQINDNFEVKQYPEKELAETKEALIAQVQEELDKANEKNKTSLTLEEYVKEEYALTMDEFNADIEEDAKAVVKDEMIVYYIARKEQIALTDLDYEEKALEQAAEDNFSDLEQYTAYLVYAYGILDTEEEMTDEARQKATNKYKEEILFTMVDDFVFENTVQK